MVGACSLSGVWSVAGRLRLVRGAPPLRQCRRICSTYSLLLFARHHSRNRGLVCRARDWRRLGSLRIYFHRHCRRAHPLCSSRSCSLELATHHSAEYFFRAGGRIAILADCPGATRSLIHTVPCADSPGCGCRDLDRRVGARCFSHFRRLFLSSPRLLASTATRHMVRNYLADFWHEWSVSGIAGPAGAKLPRARSRYTCGTDYVCRLAAHALLRQHRTPHCGTAVLCSWLRQPSLPGPRLSVGKPALHVRLRLRNQCRFV